MFWDVPPRSKSGLLPQSILVFRLVHPGREYLQIVVVVEPAKGQRNYVVDVLGYPGIPGYRAGRAD
jgi:hypothetical protein